MDITLTKISDERHRIEVTRADGSSDRIELDTRESLRHDLAHYAAEIEVPIRRGFWGCVADGASLNGAGVGGPDAALAESLAGPFQTLMRTGAPAVAYAETLRHVLPDADHADLAVRIHERIRQLRGHWRATARGTTLRLVWPE